MTAVGNDEGTKEDLLQDLEEVEEDLASALRKMEKVNVQLWVRWASDSRHLKKSSRQ